MKSEPTDPRAQHLLTVLKMIQLAEGLDLCDRCGDALYEEALRCDGCCGKFGAPSVDALREWFTAHPGFFRDIKRAWEEECYAQEEEAWASDYDPEGYTERAIYENHF